MSRRTITAVAALLFVLAAGEKWLWGIPDMFVALPKWWGIMTEWLTSIDYWFLNHDLHVVPIALAIAIILSGWIIPDVWPFFKKAMGSKEVRAFEDAFQNQTHQKARHDFFWNIEVAYRAYARKADQAASKGELVQMVKTAKFPDKFLLSENKSFTDYAMAITWPDENGKKISAFCDSLYESMLSPEGTKLIPKEQHVDFLEGRRISAKFWDDWGRSIIDGRLSIKQITKPFNANKLDIKRCYEAEGLG
ncbi:MAG: hypothetical protein O3C34_18215, partial [Proteobacteria bacterium]|nr:hypothetical protein [Pseudomonadota bacterium]